MNVSMQKILALEGIIKENQKEIDKIHCENENLKKIAEKAEQKSIDYKNKIISLEQELMKKDNLLVRLELKHEKLKNQVNFFFTLFRFQKQHRN